MPHKPKKQPDARRFAETEGLLTHRVRDALQQPKRQKRAREELRELRREGLPDLPWYTQLQEDEQNALRDYFVDLRRHLQLPAWERVAMIRDFAAALQYYHEHAVPLAQALQRLSVQQLGGFYARASRWWYALDSAAKIYPFAMSHGGMALFRLSVYLQQPVQPALLQVALTFCITRYPSFATTVKKGFFWHYLDATKRRYAAEAESGIPCRPLRVGGSGAPSLRVLYYQNRISVEFFHILTDATGGMEFLKTLTAAYLRLCGLEGGPWAEVLAADALPEAQETENAFLRVDKARNATGFVQPVATQFSGRLARVQPCRILHFRMDAAQLHAVARSKQVTVTEYVLSRIFMAARRATDEMNGEFSVQVPVNLRKFYHSRTVRNFSMYCGIRLPVARCTQGDDLLGEIHRQMEEKTAKGAMDEMMHAANRLVHALRYVPLALKAPFVRLGHGILGDRLFSTTLSNLGVVALPKAFLPHVQSLDFVLGSETRQRACCALVTYGNVATLSVSKNTADPSFEETLYAALQADAIPVVVEGYDRDEDSFHLS